ncbi:MAG: class I tRNA ligase family protein [Candidatus Bathyarchaeia archaeon]
MLNIYNTLTGKIEPFQPKENKQVKMFTCGPSTYQPAHLGNYRTFLFEDILQRYLEYLGYKVKRLMALTDVEDKAIEQAKKENLTVKELSSKNEKTFFDDFKLLRIKKPDYAVRASTAVDQASVLISKLVDCGVAYHYRYKGEENVYFDPLKFEGFGKLSHLDMSKWPNKHRRFHKDTYPGTPWNMGDFILWHGCSQSDICYKTEVGIGRPAWNIQDPAIVTKFLGFEIDVACGGVDNLVRHHDYTIAVVESVSGRQFARYWLHGAHLYVDGKKMSKSKGNVYYPKDLQTKGYSGQQIRFFLIYGCYQETLDFTYETFATASKKLETLKATIKELQKVQPKTEAKSSQTKALLERIVLGFEAAMNNNLDVKTAFDSLYETVSELEKLKEQISVEDKKKIAENLRQVDSVLQLDLGF